MKYYCLNLSYFYDYVQAQKQDLVCDQLNLLYEKNDNDGNHCLVMTKQVFSTINNKIGIKNYFDPVNIEEVNEAFIALKIKNTLDCVDTINSIIRSSKFQGVTTKSILQLVVDESKINEELLPLHILVCNNNEYFAGHGGAIVISEEFLELLQYLDILDFSVSPAFKEGIDPFYSQGLHLIDYSKPKKIPTLDKLNHIFIWSDVHHLAIGSKKFDPYEFDYLKDTLELFVAPRKQGAVVQFTSDQPYYLNQTEIGGDINISALFNALNYFQLKTPANGLLQISDFENYMYIKVEPKKETGFIVVEQFNRCVSISIQVSLFNTHLKYSDMRLGDNKVIYSEAFISDILLYVAGQQECGQNSVVLCPLKTNEVNRRYTYLDREIDMNSDWLSISPCGNLIASPSLFHKILKDYPEISFEEIDVLSDCNNDSYSKEERITIAFCLNVEKVDCLDLAQSKFTQIGNTQENKPIRVFSKIVLRRDLLTHKPFLRVSGFDDVYLFNSEFANKFLKNTCCNFSLNLIKPKG